MAHPSKGTGRSPGEIRLPFSAGGRHPEQSDRPGISEKTCSQRVEDENLR